ASSVNPLRSHTPASVSSGRTREMPTWLDIHPLTQKNSNSVAPTMTRVIGSSAPAPIRARTPRLVSPPRITALQSLKARCLSSCTNMNSPVMRSPPTFFLHADRFEILGQLKAFHLTRGRSAFRRQILLLDGSFDRRRHQGFRRRNLLHDTNRFRGDGDPARNLAPGKGDPYGGSGERVRCPARHGIDQFEPDFVQIGR